MRLNFEYDKINPDGCFPSRQNNYKKKLKINQNRMFVRLYYTINKVIIRYKQKTKETMTMNLKGKVLKFMASNKDAELIDREGVQNHTALRTAKALRLEPQEAKKIMEILVQDGLAEKRSARYCGATRYWITNKGKEVAGL
jgi:hypothetical protein